MSSTADLVVFFAFVDFLSALWYYVQRLYFPIILRIFSTVVKINLRSNTARGKTSRQCEMAWALQVVSEKGASSWLAILPIPKHRFALHKGAFWDALPTIWMATFPSTISLHLWPTLHNQACTNMHLWWIPFDSTQWAKGHDCWVLHWSVSQCQNWATTSTTHRRTSYTRISNKELEDGACLDIAADNFWGSDWNVDLWHKGV